jgi:hypothetical protein
MEDTEKRDAIHEVLANLEATGELTPDKVIEEARARESPLHDQFTWDLKAAAMMTWRSQARALISGFQISVVVHRKEYTIQEFVEAPGKAEREQGYVAFTKIKNSKELAREFIDRELGIASTYVCKTRDYARVLGLERQVEKVVKDLSSVRVAARSKATSSRRENRGAATL